MELVVRLQPQGERAAIEGACLIDVPRVMNLRVCPGAVAENFGFASQRDARAECEPCQVEIPTSGNNGQKWGTQMIGMKPIAVKLI
jgi:hypothetical protein